MPVFSTDNGVFSLDGKPMTILSGAIHYFRTHPDQWRDRLEKLKDCGFNTVETYTPWNLHEKTPGCFDFTGMLDIGRFLDTAAEVGLYAIVRPGPFICAEWEFGGLPADLLADGDIRLRCRDARFIERQARYLKALFGHVVPRQVTHGGNVLMLQVENEYGSYGDDKVYLEAMRDIYIENGVDVPLFTSDGLPPHIFKMGGSTERWRPGTSAAMWLTAQRSSNRLFLRGRICAPNSGAAGSITGARRITPVMRPTRPAPLRRFWTAAVRSMCICSTAGPTSAL